MSNTGKKALLVLPDSLSSRVFFSCGIVHGLADALDGRLDVVFTFDLAVARDKFDFDPATWVGPDARVNLMTETDLLARRPLRPIERVRGALDLWLDERIGYFPLAVRCTLTHGFHLPRLSPGHRNTYLNSAKARPFPRSKRIFDFMFRWHYGPSRFVHPAVLQHMRDGASALAVSNVQTRSAVKYLLAADRLGLPIAGHIGSWDHPVGKGVVFPRCSNYVVQNTFMVDALVKYHGIDAGRIAVTGWPQTDLFARGRPRADYAALLGSYGLDPELPCVLFAGNSPGNAPYEPRLMERFADWWASSGACARYSVIFRPHPKDSDWRKRFAAILGRQGLYVQSSSYSDVDVLNLLLAHADCVVTNAGTILLDSLVNGRPVVCVLFDEGSPPGSLHARNNISGKHYQDLMASGAFLTATGFEELTRAIDRSLAAPGELAREREAISRRTVGEVDGKAAARVVAAILAGMSAAPSVR